MNNEAQVSFRLTTADDLSLPTYDNTKLVALNTCPTWGVMRYQMHKRMPGDGRSMPLECGSAMHEVFAWVRICTLAQHHQWKMATNAACRIFGYDRFMVIRDQVILDTTSDRVELCKRGAIAVLETSGFYDDPRDKRRTLSNMEEASFAYIDRWRWDQPVWVRDPTDPLTDVGIEIPFDIVVDAPNVSPFRITGKIDGIHVHRNNTVTLHENKTASRLGDAWSMSFALSSQVTHYCLAATIFTGQRVDTADIFGLSIPLPKTYDFGGFVREPVTRQDYHYARWITWLLHTVQMYDDYRDDPYTAPKYTHSCNRYFRACSLIPFCDADDEEQRAIVGQMEHDEWSPLAKALED